MVLVINCVLTIWAVSSSKVQNGLGTLQDGSCKRTTTLTFWMHLAINVLSTLLLGASNYSMQCLSSPTRSEIDKAHAQGIWLDIGVPSVRNIRRLSTTRIVLWWLLAISSVPLHLLYNSAVFSSLCTREYNVFLVSSDFLDGAPFNASWTDVWNLTNNLQDYQNNQVSLQKLGNKACVEIYTAPVVSTYSDLILVSNYSDSNNSLLFTDPSQDSQLVTGSYQSSGYCSLPLLSNCDPSGAMTGGQEWSIDIWQNETIADYGWSIEVSQVPMINRTSIQYCLSKPVKEHCKLQFSLAIMIVVIICNLTKTICMGIIAWKQDSEPLVTLGDAIASFLDRPDMTTEGNCVVGKTRFVKNRSWGLLPSRWTPKRSRWFGAASSRRWLVCNIL